jgi:hypothetical protein
MNSKKFEMIQKLKNLEFTHSQAKALAEVILELVRGSLRPPTIFLQKLKDAGFTCCQSQAVVESILESIQDTTLITMRNRMIKGLTGQEYKDFYEKSV